MPSEPDSYFSPLMVRRQTLFWTVATRVQLWRWEVALAGITRTLLRHEQPDGPVVWEAERERHLTFISARNLFRALNLAGQEVRLDHDLRLMKWGRDLLEHWDENMPVFNKRPRTAEPKKRSGISYADRYQEHSPYSVGSWKGGVGPLLAPDLPASALHETLDQIEEQILQADPNLARFVQEPPPSPWRENWWPVPESPDPV